MAIVGALMLCAAELARIPFAMAFRTHRSFGIRLMALLGAVMMIVVTAKGISQVLASAYHPRLIAVAEAKSELKQACWNKRHTKKWSCPFLCRQPG